MVKLSGSCGALPRLRGRGEQRELARHGLIAVWAQYGFGRRFPPPRAQPVSAFASPSTLVTTASQARQRSTRLRLASNVHIDLVLAPVINQWYSVSADLFSV